MVTRGIKAKEMTTIFTTGKLKGTASKGTAELFNVNYVDAWLMYL